jgi:transposase
MGEAIGYALGQWDALTLFLTDPHLPVDNNASERALRVAARRGSLCVTPSSAWNPKRSLVRRIATRAMSTMSACA